jgi:trehalose-6-phosphate synthase
MNWLIYIITVFQTGTIHKFNAFFLFIYFYSSLYTRSILWPLFHYHPGEISFNEEWWEAYQKVNNLFADAIAKIVQDGDLVWIQDYHLMLLPAMLRKKTTKNIKVGWFLHTPFPSSEIYR